MTDQEVFLDKRHIVPDFKLIKPGSLTRFDRCCDIQLRQMV
jgi:hypothetical protein